MIVSCAMPIAAATQRAPSSSPVASAGETAVTASARSPSARCGERRDERGVDAARERDDATLPSSREPLPRAAVAMPALTSRLPRGRGERRGPDRLHRRAGAARRARAVVVLGREVDDRAVEQADLDAHAAAVDLDVALVALELEAVERAIAHAERARLAQDRLGDRSLVGGPGERGEHEARPALFICTGVVQTSSAPAAKQRSAASGTSSGEQVVEVRLDQRRPAARRAGSPLPTQHADDVRAARRGRACRRRSRRARASAAAAGRSASASVGDERGAGRRDELGARRRRRTSGAPRAARASPARAAAARRARPRRSRARTGSGEQTTRSTPSSSSASATPQTSASASTPPTSWKCTSLGRDAVDARPRPRRAAGTPRARARAARSGRPAASISARIVAPGRGAAWSVGGVRRATCSAAIPWRSTRSTRELEPVDAELRPGPAERASVGAGVEQRRRAACRRRAPPTQST